MRTGEQVWRGVYRGAGNHRERKKGEEEVGWVEKRQKFTAHSPKVSREFNIAGSKGSIASKKKNKPGPGTN